MAACTTETDHTKCIDGYYLSSGTCLKCVTPCATCINETTCITCGFDPTGLRY